MKKILSVLFILSFTAYCCQKETNQRLEVSQRYEDGKKKTLHKYSGKGEFEKLVEIVTYNKAGQIIEVKNLAAQTKKMMWWHKNGEIRWEEFYQDGEPLGEGNRGSRVRAI
ncbi:MAG: hypothetical protein GTO45_32485 [Candidatus Aminicenantes bacterium]|nr:hypothetical protein [Candidatus Aminicenantes bacterium]NIM83469.1 hypothetical protein [Candidatus Aminicenantes bacterium]NIN22861.1 hypothetical protein [Candidatus Aminicenantes bacterium]NIN46597.1 hypothetical protein [Candidatus Aminicenantes bacterium]NIN89500.1 hypothetical protein [Candidatus Aminicenantes bacterium]